MPPAPQAQAPEPIEAVAARLGAAPGWVARWLPHLPGAQAGQEGWKVGPAAAALLAELRRLDVEGRADASMRRIVGLEPKAGRIVGFPSPQPAEGQEALAPSPASLPPAEAPRVPADQQMQVRLVEAAMAAQSRMAMELARLAHTSGRWQGQLQAMAGQLGHTQQALRAAQARVAELEAQERTGGDPHLKERLVAAGQVLAKLQAELGQEREARAALVAELEALRAQAAEAPALPSGDPKLPGPSPEEVEQLRQELAEAKARLSAQEWSEAPSGKAWWNFWE